MPDPLRYVILHHTAIPNPHFDLMFETSPGSPLATWRTPHWPLNKDSTLIPVADHRPIYLQYEGNLSNNRGTVRQIASGTHEIIENNPRELVVILDDGSTLHLVGSAAGRRAT